MPEALRRKLHALVEVDPVAEMVTAKNAHHLLRDLVVTNAPRHRLHRRRRDQSISVKACGEKQIKALAAMGAGAKADPTRWCVAPLRDAIHDPLATKLRWVLRGRAWTTAVLN